MRCEDYPCCGHGPPPLGDGGGCPDEDGCFDCVECGSKLPRNAPSAICNGCRSRWANMSPEERDWEMDMREARDLREGNY